MSEKKELPNGWVIEKLGDICFTTSGGTPSRKVSSFYNGKIPWVKSGELDKGIITKTEESITEEAVKNSSAKIFPKGTLLIALYGATIGKLGFLGVDASTNQAICGIFENENVYLHFLKYYLFHKRNKLIEKGAGGAQPNISQTILKELLIPLPPLAEQQRIVAKIEELFSSLDKGIESLKTAQEQLKVYRQAVLKWAFEGKLTEKWRNNNMESFSIEELLNKIIDEKKSEAFNKGKTFKHLFPITDKDRENLPKLPNQWIWVKLGDHSFVTKLAGFEFTKYVKYKEFGDIPVIRAQNVSKFSFIPRNFLYVDRDIMEKLPRSRVFGGELLLVFVGAGLGNVGIVPENKEYFLGPNVAKIAIESQFINKFIFYFLTSKLGFSNVVVMQKATAQGSISMANIREVSIPLLSQTEQQLIVQEIESRLSVCDKIEESIKDSLLQAESLRQSILKKAFEGKLVEQDPNDEPASLLLERIKAEKENNKPTKVVKERKLKPLKSKKETK